MASRWRVAVVGLALVGAAITAIDVAEGSDGTLAVPAGSGTVIARKAANGQTYAPTQNAPTQIVVPPGTYRVFECGDQQYQGIPSTVTVPAHAHVRLAV